MLVVWRRHVSQAARQSRISDGASNGPSHKIVRDRARPIVEDGLIELVRNHVVIDAIAAALHFIEDAISATNDGLLAERTPGKSEPWRPLGFVVVRGGDRQSGLGGALDQVAEQRVGGGGGELRVQIHFADNDGLR